MVCYTGTTGKGGASAMEKSGIKIAAQNRKARHD